MRLKNKKRILELTETINEGIEYSKMVRGKEAMQMMQDCIAAITYIGNYDNEEKLYDISEIIKTKISRALLEVNDKCGFEEMCSEIKESIDQLRNIVIHNIETNVEIVFMPYKVSMWDSMESIWEAAKKDKNCTCHVVPIPYCQLTSEGKVESVCYEGDKFSDDIDITHYDDYKFDINEPDIIYIHNPYDNYNKLTMIYPKFFSSNLAKYTDMLVYVPYFVGGSYKSIEVHKSLCMLPGAMNANKVIVQSDVQKELYVACGFSEENILALGSPKMDATLKSLKKHKCIPNTWSKSIEKRKVFLLAVGISDLLSEDDWMDNLEKIFRCFVSKKEECVLIWRPHPLTEITLNTMRVNLLKRYKELCAFVEKEENIIIDFENDVYTSFQLSDALISDYSSVLLQYLVTEKPILSIMNKELSAEDRYYNVDYRGCYFTNKGDKIEDFIELVIDDKDYKKEERIERFKNSVKNIDGTCGEKVHKKITSEYMKALYKY